MPEGMTGTAVELLCAPERDADDSADPAGPIESRELGRHLIGRTVTVVWSKTIRREDGRLDHFESGLRFL